MLPFKLIYSNGYYLPIGAHVFPAEKYRLIHDRLLATSVAEATDFLEPESATDQDILLVHTPEYVHKLKSGTLSPREEMELEIPYTRELVNAFWLAAGGSIAWVSSWVAQTTKFRRPVLLLCRLDPGFPRFRQTSCCRAVAN